jgi:tetratricopeptide (TPR) repeat protein
MLLRVLSLIVFLGLGISVPCLGNPAVAIFNKANEYYSNGKFKKAIILYRKARGSGIDQAVCSFNIGNCYFQAGDLPAAAAAYRSAVSVKSKVTAEALLNLGGVLYRLGNYGESISAYRRGLARSSENVSAWLYLAEAYEKTGDNVNTLYALEKAAALRPGDVSIVYQTAETYISLGEIPQAINLVSRAYSLTPDETDFLFYIADLHIMNNDTVSAISAYREALTAAPDNYNGHYRLADILATNDQPFLAMEHLNLALGIKPDFSDAAVFLGNITFDLQWWDRSINAYRQARNDSDNEGVLGIINIVYEFIQRKDLPRAHELFRELEGYAIQNPVLLADIEKLRKLLSEP